MHCSECVLLIKRMNAKKVNIQHMKEEKKLTHTHTLSFSRMNIRKIQQLRLINFLFSDFIFIRTHYVSIKFPLRVFEQWKTSSSIIPNAFCADFGTECHFKYGIVFSGAKYDWISEFCCGWTSRFENVLEMQNFTLDVLDGGVVDS